MTSQERREFIKQRISAKKRRRVSKAERIVMKRKAVKNRKRRKYRTRVMKSRKGMKARGLGGKLIRKRFFVVTYDANGKALGTLWYPAPKPNDAAKDKYKADYGIKHPMLLPIISPAKLASMKKKNHSSKKSKNSRRRSK